MISWDDQKILYNYSENNQYRILGFFKSDMTCTEWYAEIKNSDPSTNNLFKYTDIKHTDAGFGEMYATEVEAMGVCNIHEYQTKKMEQNNWAIH